MAAKKQNILIQQGSNTHFEFQLYDANGNPLTDSSGYSGTSRVRQSVEANNIYTFAVSFANGVMMLDMGATYSATIPEGNYYYTVDVTAFGSTDRIMEGMATVTPDM